MTPQSCNIIHTIFIFSDILFLTDNYQKTTIQSLGEGEVAMDCEVNATSEELKFQ